MHYTSYAKMKLYSQVIASALKGSEPIRVLDIGSRIVDGSSLSYQTLFKTPEFDYFGLDIEPGSNVDIVVPPRDWNCIESGSFDLVISGQMLEHCENPFWVFKQVSRILNSSNGVFVVICPSKGPEHRFPIDCWRVYPDGLRSLAIEASLVPVHISTDWDFGEWGDSCGIFSKNEPSTSLVEDFKSIHLSWLKANLDEISSEATLKVLFFEEPDPLNRLRISSIAAIRHRNPWMAAKACELALFLGAASEFVVECAAVFVVAAQANKINFPVEQKLFRPVFDVLSNLPEWLMPHARRIFKGLGFKAVKYLMDSAFAASCFMTASFASNVLVEIFPGRTRLLELDNLAKLLTSSVHGESTVVLESPLSSRLVNRLNLVNSLSSGVCEKGAYLELGVEYLTNILAVNVQTRVGVDPEPKLSLDCVLASGGNWPIICKMTSRKFFAALDVLAVGGECAAVGDVPLLYDLVFIDGLHTYAESLFDVVNSIMRTRVGGYVVMHDCIPPNKAASLADFSLAKQDVGFSGEWTGDVYKTLIHVNVHFESCKLWLLASDYGLGVIKVTDDLKHELAHCPSGTLEVDPVIALNDYDEFSRKHIASFSSCESSDVSVVSDVIKGA